ncbi:MAG: type III pantothenate kinase [Planctomycetota bacterium]
MQLIAIDIGNSSTRISADTQGAADGDRWLLEKHLSNDEPFSVNLDGTDAIWCIASVNSARLAEVRQWIETSYPLHKVKVIGQDDIPIESEVKSRHETGVDRLVAAWAAREFNDGEGPVLIIDAGTAVTIDLVDANGCFQGGVIFPGTRTTLSSLSNTTDALPDLAAPEFLELAGDVRNDFVGKSTNEAIVRGVVQAQIGAIRHTAKRMMAMPGMSRETPVYVTGGGIPDLKEGLPSNWNYVTDLVLQGVRMIGQLHNQSVEHE